MKKRIWSLVLCAALVLVLAAGLLPQRAQAAYSNEQLGLWFHGNFIRAQGNAIVLEDGGDGYTRIKVGGQYVNFSKLKYSDGDNMFTCKAGDPTAADLSKVDIYGGWDDGGSGNTSITINGGNVAFVHGGSSSGDMTGSVTITMNGGRAQRLTAAGNAGSVSSSTITVNGGTVSVMIEMVGDGVTGDAALVITGGSVGDIYRDYTHANELGGELSVYTPGIGQLRFSKDFIDNYVILEGKNWSAKGNTAKAIKAMDPNRYLKVDNGQTLTVEAGETFTGGIDNYGVIYNYGTIGDIVDNQGVIHNYGTISAQVNQDDVGTVYNYGTVGTVNGGYVTKEVSHWAYYCTMDQSAWQSKEHNHQDDYTGTVIPSAGHVLADSFDAVVTNADGSKTYLKSGVDFDYDPLTGAIRIPNSKLTGPVHIRTYTLVDLGSDALDLRLSEDSFTFNGKEHKPVLLWNGIPVGEDGITATYENNVSAGTGKVTFTADEGSGYTGQLTLEFTIDPVDVADVAWTAESVTYNGKAQYPTISGKIGDYQLKWPEDYKNSGAAQMNAGDYTVSVHGQGNFIGTVEIPWSIEPLDIGGSVESELVLSEHVYDGTKQTATVKSFRVEGMTLTEGKDFIAEFLSGTDAGEYEFAIKGIGNFTGFYEGRYKIAPKVLTAGDLEFADETITKVYDGDAVIDAKVQVKADTIGNEALKEVNGLCVFDSAWAGVATKVTFTTAETELGNYIVPANLRLEKAATITPKPVKVDSVSAQNREYDGSKKVNLTPAMPWIEGIVDADLVYASVTAGQADSKNAGTRSAELTFKLEGEHAGNYCVSEDSQKTVEFEITPKSWSVTDIEVAGEDFLVTAEGILPGDDATPGVVKAIWYYGSYQVDGQAALAGEDRDNYAKAAKFSANIFRPEAGKEYTVNTNDWTNGNFTVTAAEGFTVCLLSDGTFGQDLSFGEEGEKEVTFYVKSEEYDFVSRQVKETCKIDKTAPTGKITIGERSWNAFFEVEKETITNADVAAKITAEDSGSGVAKVEYLATYRMWHEEDLERITEWVEGSEVKVPAEDGKKAFIYAKITDKAGNVTFVASDGWAFDTLAPGVFGVKEGVTYYVSTAVTVNDKNLESVKLNGEEVGASFTVPGDAAVEYTIVATDKAGNETVMTFATGKLEEAEDVLKDLAPENVTLEDESDIDGLLKDLKEQDLTKATAEEKAAVEELIQQAEQLQEQLEKLVEAANTEAIDKAVEILEKDNGTIGDIDVVKQAIADIDKLLKDFDGNLTEDDEKGIEDVRDELVKLQKKLEKKAAATTPNTGDLLLPMAGTVCVIAILGMAVTLVGFKRRRR